MRVSVVLATYNGEAFLGEQLGSLTVQTARPHELVVADDGSTDATLGIVEAFARSAPFPVRVHRNPGTLGFTENFLRAAGQAEGDVLAFCDQDDVWRPEKLERCLAMLDDPDVVMAIHAGQVVDATLTRRGRRHPDFARDGAVERMGPVLMNGIVPGFALVFKRVVTDRLLAAWPAERYAEAFRKHGNLMGHDLLAYGTARSIGRVAYTAAVLADYRVHARNVTATEAPFAPALERVGGMLQDTRLPDASLYAHYADRWQQEVRVLEAIMANDPGLVGLRHLHAYLSNRSRTFAERAALYEGETPGRRVACFLGMVRGGSYGSRKAGRLGLRSAAKDLAFCLAPRVMRHPNAPATASAGQGGGLRW
ncbi:MAG TPA: glycosyltransferase [Rubricoccaceae bacterium]|nr:glycosyltransferase [Rubricoccaceae bacterium]